MSEVPLVAFVRALAAYCAERDVMGLEDRKKVRTTIEVDAEEGKNTDGSLTVPTDRGLHRGDPSPDQPFDRQDGPQTRVRTGSPPPRIGRAED